MSIIETTSPLPRWRERILETLHRSPPLTTRQLSIRCGVTYGQNGAWEEALRILRAQKLVIRRDDGCYTARSHGMRAR